MTLRDIPENGLVRTGGLLHPLGSQSKETSGFNPNLETDLMYSESFRWALPNLQEKFVCVLGIFLRCLVLLLCFLECLLYIPGRTGIK